MCLYPKSPPQLEVGTSLNSYLHPYASRNSFVNFQTGRGERTKTITFNSFTVRLLLPLVHWDIHEPGQMSTLHDKGVKKQWENLKRKSLKVRKNTNKWCKLVDSVGIIFLIVPINIGKNYAAKLQKPEQKTVLQITSHIIKFEQHCNIKSIKFLKVAVFHSLIGIYQSIEQHYYQ